MHLQVLKSSKSVSGSHAKIVVDKKKGIAKIVDTSLNGTFVNDSRIHNRWAVSAASFNQDADGG